MEYKMTSKRKKKKKQRTKQPQKTPKTYIDILLSFLYIKETRLHEHGFVFMTFYEDLQDVLETQES